jgi:predicted RNase H-like nuclease (RuvC/YqgF family)
MPAARLSKVKQTETDIAVLQVQVANLDEKIDDLKSDLLEIKNSLKQNAEHNETMIEQLKKENAEQHSELAEKVEALEKWRWMLIGAAALAGAMGWTTVQALFTPQ